MEFKGTKGEWVISEINISDLKSIAIFSDEKQEVLLHMYLPNSEITEENKSNAKLIASAPYLLEALQGFVNLKDLILPDSDVSIEHEGEAQAVFSAIQKAQKAIEKALL